MCSRMFGKDIGKDIKVNGDKLHWMKEDLYSGEIREVIALIPMHLACIVMVLTSLQGNVTNTMEKTGNQWTLQRIERYIQGASTNEVSFRKFPHFF